MDLAFREYSSIENVQRTKEINTIIEQGKSGGEWVVSEKIHGANGSFWIDDEGIKLGKRTSFLHEGASFFNFQDVMRDNEASLRKMYNGVKESMPELGVCSMTVYGELYGGTYPHIDVPRTYMAMTVQKGIYYCPGNRFAAFDVVLHFKKEDGDVAHRVMGHDFVYDKCNEYGVPHVPVLFRGTFQECLDYPNEFQSHVPAMHGLPLLENNIAEGTVIKPVIPAFFWNGGRIILKNKNDKWSEREKKQKPKREFSKDNNFEFELSEEADELLDEILAYVNENRLRNVLSKMERPIIDRHFGMIVGNMNKDIIEEFLKDYRERFIALEEKERKYITKKMGGEVMQLVRSHFLNIIDDTF